MICKNVLAKIKNKLKKKKVWLPHAKCISLIYQIFVVSESHLNLFLFPVCSHRAHYTRRYDSRGPVCQLYCREANSWTPGSINSQSFTVNTHQPQMLNRSTLSSLCIFCISIFMFCYLSVCCSSCQFGKFFCTEKKWLSCHKSHERLSEYIIIVFIVKLAQESQCRVCLWK